MDLHGGSGRHFHWLWFLNVLLLIIVKSVLQHLMGGKHTHTHNCQNIKYFLLLHSNSRIINENTNPSTSYLRDWAVLLDGVNWVSASLLESPQNLLELNSKHTPGQVHTMACLLLINQKHVHGKRGVYFPSYDSLMAFCFCTLSY